MYQVWVRGALPCPLCIRYGILVCFSLVGVCVRVCTLASVAAKMSFFFKLRRGLLGNLTQVTQVVTILVYYFDKLTGEQGPEESRAV